MDIIPVCLTGVASLSLAEVAIYNTVEGVTTLRNRIELLLINMLR